MMTLIFKICGADEWRRAEAEGVFTGSAVDVKDGFIHLSSAGQVRETAARHFAGRDGLMLAAFRAGVFGGTLKWEPSRGGALFPHVYGPIRTAAAEWAVPLPLEDGVHRFPPDMPS